MKAKDPSSTDQQKLAVRTRPVPVIQLNQKVILGIAMVIATVVSLAMVNAFVSEKPSKVKIAAPEQLPKVDDRNVTPLDFVGVPESYTDVKRIKRFLQTEAPTPTVVEDPRFDEVRRELYALQREYDSLKRRLAEKENEKVEDSAEMRAIKRGGLTFSGIGSNMDNAFSMRRRENEEAVASPAQEEQLRNKADSNRRLDIAKGYDPATAIYDMHNVVKPYSKYLLQAGSVIPATLITCINTTQVGTIIAQVSSDVYDTVSGKYLLIPRGSKLIGEYSSNVRQGQGRVLIEFGRVVRPDGSSILLSRALGTDAIGNSGLNGDVDNHWMRIIGAATLSTVLTAGAAIGANAIYRHSNNSYPSSYENAVSGAANAFNNIGQQITGRAMNIPPTITVPAGTPFFVSVRKDMTLTPYRRAGVAHFNKKIRKV